MPIEWLMQYWKKAAKYALPFMKNRKIAVQQVFGKNIIYRRHGDTGLPDKSGWISIDSVEEILAWAKLHAYSFHAHLLGENDTWFVMDIDSRRPQLWELTKLATHEMSRILSKKKIKHLIKFSGNRGFHIMWSLGKIKPNWLSFRKQIRDLATELETILQKKYHGKFYPVMNKKLPILTTSSTDKKTIGCILIDEQIIHKNGMIRVPYSVHPTTGLIAIPLKPNQVLKFALAQANPARIRFSKIKLPIN